MRKSFTSILSLLLVVAMLFSLTGCGASSEIKALLQEFESSCNSLDFDAVLDCINPKVSDSIKVALGFVGLFTDKDADDMFNSLAEYLSEDEIGGADFFSSIDIQVGEIAVDGESATVSATLTYELDGEETVREAEFNCIYYAEKWYISDFSIV